MTKRNWKKLNRKYVQEGYLYLTPGFIDRWHAELASANSGRRGRPYRYPDSLFRFCSVLRTAFGQGDRQVQGMLQALQQYLPLPAVPSASQIHRRIAALGLDIVTGLADSAADAAIALDASGIKPYHYGQWRREKHRTRRPFLKLHIAVDTETKQAQAVALTEDSVTDGAEAIPLLEQVQQHTSIEQALMDGAYDQYAIWRYCQENAISPVIKMRDDASEKGISLRSRSVRERNRMGEEEWARTYGYGQRWQSETWFSAFKRRFGEHCRARKPEAIQQEVLLKAALCNQHIAAAMS